MSVIDSSIVRLVGNSVRAPRCAAVVAVLDISYLVLLDSISARYCNLFARSCFVVNLYTGCYEMVTILRDIVGALRRRPFLL